MASGQPDSTEARESGQTPVPKNDEPSDVPGSPFTEEDVDVSLEVPQLNVEEISLEVEDLRAHISARAELVDFLNIGVGVDVYLDRVKLQVKGVEAQLQLKVKLERILGTIDRALEVMAANPAVRRGLPEDAGGTGGDAAPPATADPARRGSGEEREPENHSGLRRDEEYVEDEVNTSDDAGEGSGSGEAPLDDEGNVVEATRAARKRAGDLGVSLGDVRGTGAGGRILVRDVARAAR